MVTCSMLSFEVQLQHKILGWEVCVVREKSDICFSWHLLRKNFAHFLNVNEQHTQGESVDFFTEVKYSPHLHQLQ